MTNLKKLGLTALAGSLVATTGYAGALDVTGAAKVSYVAADETESSGNPFSMTRDINFAGSGEMDNGMTISYFQLLSAGSFSSSGLTLDMGDAGVLKLSNGTAGGHGISAYEDKMPTANEQVWDDLDGEANGLVIQALIDPGDYVITEQFVYMGTTKQLTFYEANTVGSPIDDQGLIPEKLEETILNIKSQHGVMPKMLYTIPEHQNPTGSTLPKSRKLEILDICHKYGIPILEDDCYVDNRFEGDPEPAFATLDDSGMVIYVGSFSKLIAPGLRMGFFTASDEVIDRALSVKVGSGPNQFTAYAIDGFLRSNLESQKSTYDKILKDKKESMEKGLVDFFSNTSAKWSSPKGGCYTWIEMTDGANLTEVRDEVFSRGVGYIAGDMFAPNGDGQNDFFYTHFAAIYNDVHLTVVNRWGIVVYESISYQNDWNGVNSKGNPLSEGTYYFFLTFDEGKEKNQGIVQIIINSN